MNNVFKGLFFIVAFFISGCASTVTPPFVVDNIFISHSNPKLMIQVSDKIPFNTVVKNDRQALDSFGSLSSVGVKAESYFFKSFWQKKRLIISIVKFKGIGGKWEMWLPDYSEFSNIISTGSVVLDGEIYSTGTYLRSEKNGWYIFKSYARISGPGNNIQLQIHYLERIHTFSPGTEFIKEFNARADYSFTILPITEDTPLKKNEHKEDKAYLKQNADKKDGYACLNSLDCAKGYFCRNNKCVKGFTD